MVVVFITVDSGLYSSNRRLARSRNQGCENIGFFSLFAGREEEAAGVDVDALDFPFAPEFACLALPSFIQKRADASSSKPYSISKRVGLYFV